MFFVFLSRSHVIEVVQALDLLLGLCELHDELVEGEIETRLGNARERSAEGALRFCVGSSSVK